MSTVVIGSSLALLGAENSEARIPEKDFAVVSVRREFTSDGRRPEKDWAVVSVIRESFPPATAPPCDKEEEGGDDESDRFICQVPRAIATVGNKKSAKNGESDTNNSSSRPKESKIKYENKIVAIGTTITSEYFIGLINPRQSRRSCSRALCRAASSSSAAAVSINRVRPSSVSS